MWILDVLDVKFCVRGLLVIVVKNIVVVIKLFWNFVKIRNVFILCVDLFFGFELNDLESDLIIGNMILLVCVVLFGVVGVRIKFILMIEYVNFNVFLLNNLMKWSVICLLRFVFINFFEMKNVIVIN